MRWTATILIVCVPAAGCVQVASTRNLAGPDRFRVECGGNCVDLSGPTSKDAAPDAFLRAVSDHLDAGRKLSATLLVKRWPDRASAALSAHRANPTATVQFIGSVQDEPMEQAHQKAVAALHASEHCRLQSQLGMWSENWRLAVVAAMRLGEPIPDPVLWEKICVQRPEMAPWPNAVTTGLTPHLARRGIDVIQKWNVAEEGLVWAAIGAWRLDRAEGSDALAAFKRAETYSAAPDWRAWTHIQQAKALMQLEQMTAAASLLTPVIERTDSRFRPVALAALGAGKFSDGHTHQARVFLEQALKSSSFPGRASAEADLALVYLTLGDADRGLQLIHTAQAQFRANGDFDQLLASLENEMRFLRQSAHESADAVQEVARALQGHIP